MIKQYISSMTQNRIGSGFGCIESRGEFTSEQVKCLDRFAAAYGIEDTDASGARVPIIMKFSVGADGSFAIGCNSFVDGKKPTHISHQFLFEGDSTLDLAVSPDEMLRLPFITDRSECEELSDTVSLLRSPMPEKDLAAAMSRWNIDADGFYAILSAIYDCTENNRKLFVALDSTFSDMSEDCASLLYHIYRYLPYQMRMLLGFDTCYSYVSVKKQIHISFADKNLFDISDAGNIVLGERGCNADYILRGGRLIHTSDKSESRCGVFMQGLKKYIDLEFSGVSCDKELTMVFDSIYSLSRGIPFGFFDKSAVYDAMFAAMTAVAGGDMTREQAEPLLRFYIAACSRLDGDAADFWGNAVYSYLSDYEADTDDGYIVTVLAAVCCAGEACAEYALPMLRNKLAKALKREGLSAIKRFEYAVTAADDDGSFYLARRVFSYDPETEKALISYKLGECETVGEVCQAAVWLAKSLGTGNVEVGAIGEITTAAEKRMQGMISQSDDIVAIQRLLSNEINEDVRSVIHFIAADALDRIDFSELEPTWFMSVKLGGDFTPYTTGGTAVMLLHDILLDTSVGDIAHYLAKYSYLSAEKRIDAAVAAGDTLMAMFTDGRLELTQAFYPTVIMLARGENTFDYELISQILSHYPAEIPRFTVYFGAKLAPLRDPSACFKEYLASIKDICISNSGTLDPRDVIVAVNDVRRSGIKCDSAGEFNATIYDAWNVSRPSPSSFFGKLTRRSALYSNSKSKANKPYYFIVAGAILLGIIIMIFVLTGEHLQQQQHPSFELYSGLQKLTVVEYTAEQHDASERISLAEANVNTTVDLTLPLKIKIKDGDVRLIEYTQKNMLSGASSYTIGDFANLTGGKDEYTVALTNVTSDLYRIYVCFDVRYNSGERIYYGVCLDKTR